MTVGRVGWGIAVAGAVDIAVAVAIAVAIAVVVAVAVAVCILSRTSETFSDGEYAVDNDGVNAFLNL